MTTLAESLIFLVYVWLLINVLLFSIRIVKFFKKDTLNYRRKRRLKTTIRVNFLYALIALIVGFILL